MTSLKIILLSTVSSLAFSAAIAQQLPSSSSSSSTSGGYSSLSSSSGNLSMPVDEVEYFQPFSESVGEIVDDHTLSLGSFADLVPELLKLSGGEALFDELKVQGLNTEQLSQAMPGLAQAVVAIGSNFLYDHGGMGLLEAPSGVTAVGGMLLDSTTQYAYKVAQTINVCDGPSDECDVDVIVDVVFDFPNGVNVDVTDAENDGHYWHMLATDVQLQVKQMYLANAFVKMEVETLGQIFGAPMPEGPSESPFPTSGSASSSSSSTSSSNMSSSGKVLSDEPTVVDSSGSNSDFVSSSTSSTGGGEYIEPYSDRLTMASLDITLEMSSDGQLVNGDMSATQLNGTLFSILATHEVNASDLDIMLLGAQLNVGLFSYDYSDPITGMDEVVLDDSISQIGLFALPNMTDTHIDDLLLKEQGLSGLFGGVSESGDASLGGLFLGGGGSSSSETTDPGQPPNASTSSSGDLNTTGSSSGSNSASSSSSGGSTATGNANPSDTSDASGTEVKKGWGGAFGAFEFFALMAFGFMGVVARRRDSV